MNELEKAAASICGVHPDWSKLECFRIGFKEGAQWQAKQSPWRIVADEPPPEYEDVLLSAGSRPDIFVGYFNGEDFMCRSTGEKIEYFRVLHWMPIPE